jgi:hypothetical protein
MGKRKKETAEAANEPASPPCLMHEVDPAYMGLDDPGRGPARRRQPQPSPSNDHQGQGRRRPGAS